MSKLWEWLDWYAARWWGQLALTFALVLVGSLLALVFDHFNVTSNLKESPGEANVGARRGGRGRPGGVAPGPVSLLRILRERPPGRGAGVVRTSGRRRSFALCGRAPLVEARHDAAKGESMKTPAAVALMER